MEMPIYSDEELKVLGRIEPYNIYVLIHKTVSGELNWILKEKRFATSIYLSASCLYTNGIFTIGFISDHDYRLTAKVQTSVSAPGIPAYKMPQIELSYQDAAVVRFYNILRELDSFKAHQKDENFVCDYLDETVLPATDSKALAWNISLTKHHEINEYVGEAEINSRHFMFHASYSYNTIIDCEYRMNDVVLQREDSENIEHLIRTAINRSGKYPQQTAIDEVANHIIPLTIRNKIVWNIKVDRYKHSTSYRCCGVPKKPTDKIFPENYNLDSVWKDGIHDHTKFSVTGGIYGTERESGVFLALLNILLDQQDINDLPKSKQERTIKSGDFIVRTNFFACGYKGHTIEEITGIVHIEKNGYSRIAQIPACWCHECGKYYILNSTYEKLIKEGSPACQVRNMVISMDGEGNDWNMQPESILKKNGYNVQAATNLPDNRRQDILADIVDRKILSKYEISSYLNMFAAQKRNMQNYERAVSKWDADRAFIEAYNAGSGQKVYVNSITRKVYV